MVERDHVSGYEKEQGEAIGLLLEEGMISQEASEPDNDNICAADWYHTDFRVPEGSVISERRLTLM